MFVDRVVICGDATDIPAAAAILLLIPAKQVCDTRIDTPSNFLQSSSCFDVVILV